MLELLRQAAPLFIGSLFYMLYYRIDVLMLDKLSTRESVADFSVAFSMIDLLVELIWVQFILVFYPRMIEYYREDKRLLASRTLYVALGLAGVFTLLLIISWLLAPAAFALVFGEQYRYSGVVFTWLVPAHLLTVIFALMYRVLIITGRQVTYLVACIIGAVLNVALDYWLIPIYDVMGVIYATLTVNLLICVIITVEARRSLR
ncbi:MAG: polysaccharide biosynthesis C-terminal domain-containing protein [Pseudomonadales bacterium]|nr:polysaccharide biosynthesis C-terminal domain-containing protein [Pseudomonadales bacterium]